MSKPNKDPYQNLQEIMDDMNKILESLTNFEGTIDSVKKFNKYKDNLESTTNKIKKKI